MLSHRNNLRFSRLRSQVLRGELHGLAQAIRLLVTLSPIRLSALLEERRECGPGVHFVLVNG